ncbi:MAG: hypothetical protein ACRERC_15955 [Candidatus Binatia bacterium]
MLLNGIAVVWVAEITVLSRGLHGALLGPHTVRQDLGPHLAGAALTQPRPARQRRAADSSPPPTRFKCSTSSAPAPGIDLPVRRQLAPLGAHDRPGGAMQLGRPPGASLLQASCMWLQAKDWLEKWGKIAGAVLAICAVLGAGATMIWGAFGHFIATFDSQVMESISNRQKEAFQQQVKVAVEGVLVSDPRINEIDKMVRPFFALIDSGYTYSFELKKDGVRDIHSFKFLADKKKQRVHCYLLSRQTLRIGGDISLRVDGLPFRVRGIEYEGPTNDKLDITDSLDEDAPLHTIEVVEIESAAAASDTPANLLILVGNDLKAKGTP